MTTLAADEKRLRHNEACRRSRLKHYEKARAAEARWQREHPEARRETSRRFYSRHSEQIKQYRAENRDLLRERVKRSQIKHAERKREYDRQWKARNPKKLRASERRCRKAHPEKEAAKQHRRRARIAGNGGSFTAMEWKALCEKYDYCCLCCKQKKPLTVDHVVPISLGGSSDINNIQPLCMMCNRKKRAKIIDYRGC